MVLRADSISGAKSRWRTINRVACRPHVLWYILPRSVVVCVWEFWDLIWRTWRSLFWGRPLPIDMPFKTCAVWLRPNPYQPYRCHDGTFISQDCLVLEMHLRNATLAHIRSRGDWEECVRSDSSAIAVWLKDNPDVCAVVGVSIIGWAMRQFGAELRARRRSTGTRLKIVHMSGLLFLYQLHGLNHVMKDEFCLFEGWISRQDFMHRYLNAA